ncbi:hypothetical protein [Paenibacillus alba]|uniref:Uncharacterized protein n=1 Tax=Paenibacillus alba TaxID=1197127 RepID=A0ABU6GB00_9BACL|nr:hypothetical protein [Paenibacillus alba]MEC0231364.1 hypothetical protein [Paenibacillus alba]
MDVIHAKYVFQARHDSCKDRPSKSEYSGSWVQVGKHSLIFEFAQKVFFESKAGVQAKKPEKHLIEIEVLSK